MTPHEAARAAARILADMAHERRIREIRLMGCSTQDAENAKRLYVNYLARWW